MTTSFNFDSIDSPADLMEANENIETPQTPFARALEALEDCTYYDSTLVIGYLLQNMMEFHHTQVMENQDGRSTTAYNAFTEGKLAAAKSILQPIIQEAIDHVTGKDQDTDEETTEEDN